MINESNAKPRAMQWDEQAFISDSFVQKMNSLERWCYRTLLNKAYWCETRPYLPDNDNELWFLAGCESKEQWDSVKKNVRKMFSKRKINSKKVLAQKRLVEDWKVFLCKLQKLQDNGKLGGLAKAKLMLSSRQKEEVELEVEDKEEVEGKEEEKDSDMSFKTNVADKSLEILGVRVFPEDRGWDGLNSYKRVRGPAETLQAFEEWAKDHQGEEIRYPLTDFLRVADRYFETKFVTKTNVDPLISELALMSDGDVTFKQKQIVEISRLLEKYSDVDIKAAFREFLEKMDDRSLPYAAKDFCETAGQLIEVQKSRTQKAAQIEKQLEEVMTREREKSEAELAAIPEYKEIEL